ncbi:nucleotidyltransferase domain-containing protein [Rhizobium ruizarguesonis]
MDQTEFIELVAAKLNDETTVRGLFLGGSFGRGTPDSHSDVDLIALVEPDHQDQAIATWRSLLEGISPVVFWNQRGQGQVLLNAITEDWLRCDLSIMPPSAFIDRARKQ